MNELLKIIMVIVLTVTLAVFTWFGKIPSEAFTAFVSASFMWFLNSNKINKLQQDNDKMTTILIESATKNITDEKTKI